MSTHSPGQVVQLSFASSMAEYLRRMQELGAVEGSGGALGLNPHLAPVMEALHHVLAGGEVAVNITHGGQPGIVQELQDRMAQALQETNALSRDAGTQVETAV